MDNHDCADGYECKMLTCVDCRNQFEWSCGSQEFLNKLHEEWKEGLHDNDPRAIKQIVAPKRCMNCKDAKKARYG